MPRAIYTEAHTQTWLDIARTLRREIGLEPVYWVGKDRFERTVRSQFPAVVYHGRTDAVRGLPAAALRDMPQAPLDEGVLAQFGGVLLTTGKMLDRIDVADGFRMEERARVVGSMLRYWQAVLDRFAPDVVLFPVQPHTVYDYVIYELCKARGIPTTMFQWTVMHDWIYALDDIDTGYAAIRERYGCLLRSGARSVELDPVIDEYVSRVRGDYRTAIPDYLREQMPAQLRAALFGTKTGDFGLVGQQMAAAERPPLPPFPDLRTAWRDLRRARKQAKRHFEHRIERRRRMLRSTQRRAVRMRAFAVRRMRRLLSAEAMRRTLRRLAWRTGRAAKKVRMFIRTRLYTETLTAVVRGFRQGPVMRPLKEPGRRMQQSFGGPWSVARLRYFKAVSRKRKQYLMRYYHERCTAPDFTVPYVFVALHYQPEQTTSPTGGVFVDQQIMVDMLARLVPDGWRVYVKEHPYQFFASSVGERSRSEELYDDLLALPNVHLVPLSVTPFDLIDHARAVATVTGTSGIEAVIRGKPVLVFGYAWYRDCEGVFYTPSAAACREALREIANGCRVDGERVRLYFKAVQECCFRADMDFGVAVEPPIAHDDNVARLAAGIRSIYARRAGLMPAVGLIDADQVLR